jgi:hypothetical protein
MRVRRYLSSRAIRTGITEFAAARVATRFHPERPAMFNALESFSPVGACRAGAQLATVLVIFVLWIGHGLISAPVTPPDAAGGKEIALARAPVLDAPFRDPALERVQQAR